MTVEAQKLELIHRILELNDSQLLFNIDQMLNLFSNSDKKELASVPQSRKFGFAKGAFEYVSPDFDEIPVGFEEYMLNNEIPN
jgi:hypothetical protein